MIQSCMYAFTLCIEQLYHTMIALVSLIKLQLQVQTNISKSGPKIQKFGTSMFFEKDAPCHRTTELLMIITLKTEHYCRKSISISGLVLPLRNTVSQLMSCSKLLASTVYIVLDIGF